MMEYARWRIVAIILIFWTFGSIVAIPGQGKGNMEEMTKEEIEVVERTLRNRNNFYNVLGINRSADENVIRKAHRKIILSAHPDKIKHKDALEAIQIINVARDTLLNSTQRKLHDLDIEKLEEENKASVNRLRPWNKVNRQKTDFESSQHPHESPHEDCTNPADEENEGYKKFFGGENFEEDCFCAYDIPSKKDHYMHVLKSKFFNFAKSPNIPFTKKDFGWKNNYFKSEENFREKQTRKNQPEARNEKGEKPFTEFNRHKPESSARNRSPNAKNFAKHSSAFKSERKSSDSPNKNHLPSEFANQKSSSFSYPKVSLAGRNPIERERSLKPKSSKEQSSRESQKNETSQFYSSNENFVNNRHNENAMKNKKGLPAQNAFTSTRERPVEFPKGEGAKENSITNEKIKKEERKTRYRGTSSATNDFLEADDVTVNEQSVSNAETKLKNHHPGYRTRPKTKGQSEINARDFVQDPTVTSKKEKSPRIRIDPVTRVENSYQYRRGMPNVTSTCSQQTKEKNRHIIADRSGNSSGSTISTNKDEIAGDISERVSREPKMKPRERRRGHASEVSRQDDANLDQYAEASVNNNNQFETPLTKDAGLRRQKSTRSRAKVKKVRRKNESPYKVRSQYPRGDVEYNAGNDLPREGKLKGKLNENESVPFGLYDFAGTSATGPQKYKDAGEDVINVSARNYSENSADSSSKREKERRRTENSFFDEKTDLKFSEAETSADSRSKNPFRSRKSDLKYKGETSDDSRSKNLFRDQKSELKRRNGGEVSDDSKAKNLFGDFLGNAELGETYGKANDRNSGQGSSEFQYYFQFKPRKLLNIQIEYLNENCAYLRKLAERLQKYVVTLSEMSEFAYTRSKEDTTALDDLIDLKLLDYSYKMKNLGTYLLETSFNIKNLSKNIIAQAKLTVMRMIITDYEDNILINQAIDLADQADFLQMVSSALTDLSLSINNNSKTDDFLWKLAFKIRRRESWISRIVSYFSNHAKSFESQADCREKIAQRFKSLKKNENVKNVKDDQNGISQWQSLPKYYCPLKVLKKDENRPNGSSENVSNCLKELSDFLLLQSHYLYEQAEHFKRCAKMRIEVNSSIIRPSFELMKKFRKQYEVIRLHMEYMPEIPNALIEISNYVKESVDACKIFNIILARQEIHDFAEEIRKKALYIRQNMEPELKELSIIAKNTVVEINFNESRLHHRKFEKIASDTDNLVEEIKKYSVILESFSRNWNKRNTFK